MKLYLIAAEVGVSEDGDTLEVSEFVGSQAEAATVRAPATLKKARRARTSRPPP